MTHRRILMTTAAAVLLLLLSVCCAAAETAEEITAGCSFTNNGKTKDCSTLTDGDYSTYLPFKEKKGELLIKTGEPAAGLYVKLYNNDNKPLSYDVQVPGENGEWVTAAQGGGLLVHWHALENPVTEMKIVCTSKERLRIVRKLLLFYKNGDGLVSGCERAQRHFSALRDKCTRRRLKGMCQVRVSAGVE